jgi:hypothetical protein
MTIHRSAPRLGRSGRPVLSLPDFRKPATDAPAPLQPVLEPEKAVEVVLPRVQSADEHAALMADLAAILGCSVAELPPVLAGLSPKPLAKGIHLALADRYPAADAEALGGWLAAWTGHPAYLLRLAIGGPRYDLDGAAAGMVVDKDKRHAGWRLRQLAASGDQP